MGKPRTIRELINASKPWLEKKGVESARLDAELLIAHALGLKRLELYLDLDRPLADAEIARCRELVQRRGQREPVAHILGAREFFGLDFKVTPDVLVPRPETEHLVEFALSRVAADADGVFVDVCTGSGCVAIAILSKRPALRAIATDVSAAACAIARENAERHGMRERLDVRCGDLLDPVTETGLLFVVANPPYVMERERAELAPEVLREPALALFGAGADALDHHRRILEQARPLLRDDGFVGLEIGAAQGDAARRLSPRGYASPAVLPDLAGHDRVVVLQRAV